MLPLRLVVSESKAAVSRDFRSEMLGEVVDHFRHLHPLTEALLFIKVGRRHQVDELVTAAGSRAGVLLEFGACSLGKFSRISRAASSPPIDAAAP